MTVVCEFLLWYVDFPCVLFRTTSQRLRCGIFLLVHHCCELSSVKSLDSFRSPRFLSHADDGSHQQSPPHQPMIHSNPWNPCFSDPDSPKPRFNPRTATELKRACFHELLDASLVAPVNEGGKPERLGVISMLYGVLFQPRTLGERQKFIERPLSSSRRSSNLYTVPNVS